MSHGRDAPEEAAAPDSIIPCVDCGGICHLITRTREDGTWWVGEWVAYRCADCNDRWDVELSESS